MSLIVHKLYQLHNLIYPYIHYIQNLAFLVEVWQFKYQDTYNLKYEDCYNRKHEDTSSWSCFKCCKCKKHGKNRASSSAPDNNDTIYERADDHDVDIEGLDAIQIERDHEDDDDDDMDGFVDLENPGNIEYQHTLPDDDTEDSDSNIVYMDSIIKGLECPQSHEIDDNINDDLWNIINPTYTLDRIDSMEDMEDIENERKDQFKYPSSFEINSPLHLFTQTSMEKKQAMINKLQQMPWKGLPLNESIYKYKNDKWIQAQIIYAKYMPKQCEFTLNISHPAFVETVNAYKECKRYYGMNETVNSSLTTNINMDDKVLRIFDSVIPEIFDNLDNVSSRFTTTY